MIIIGQDTALKGDGNCTIAVLIGPLKLKKKIKTAR
jgi:hypothetical protein